MPLPPVERPVTALLRGPFRRRVEPPAAGTPAKKGPGEPPPQPGTTRPGKKRSLPMDPLKGRKVDIKV